jgi:hypothetical protein
MGYMIHWLGLLNRTLTIIDDEALGLEAFSSISGMTM